ncbi:stage II sporulation protein E [Clostridium thermosuccinogenes]|uniref:stage II sporulation protein E n=1 Tax=Clostridium thermosuccinogenes TaxID=84032 RepID=UPI000CCC5D37|nr:stage II sporulation protein E [Pseudoclostridium thermosuccinogenes]PNT91094.1 stage II sporulation protein E [Pseudoclostridium thermosuccinogenes]
MKTETVPYKTFAKASGKYVKSKGRTVLSSLLTKNTAIVFPVSFLLGKAVLMGGIMPFGTAFYAASLGYDINRLLLVLPIIFGMIAGGAGSQIYVAIAAMLIFNVLNMPFKADETRISFRYAVIAFISVLIPEMVFTYFQGFLLYDLLKGILHAFIVFTLVFIFRNAFALIDDTRKKRLFTNEEIISIAITAALALSSIADMQLFGCNPKNIICIFIILVSSYKSGPGVGAAVGVMAGLVVSMSATVTPLVIGSYAFCGLLGGIFRTLGKIGSSLGFVMGNTVLTLYLNGSTDVIIYLKEIILAIAVFMLIPEKLMNAVANVLAVEGRVNVDKRSYSQRIKDITVERLNKFSNAFREMSKTFSEISETKAVADKQDITSMFDRVAENVCKDCSLCLYCWDRNFYNTYQVMFKIIERLDEKGRIEEADIPDYFLDKCERINDFVKAVNNAYEIFKVDMVWKSRIGESRGLVSQQLEGLSKAISGLSAEINADISFKEDLEDIILHELSKEGFKAKDVTVFENKWGKYEVCIYHKSCGGKRKCLSSVEKLVSNVVGRKMIKEDSGCNQKDITGLCVLKLVEEETFRVTTGVARVCKYDGMVSGDNYTFLNTGEGKYIVALSDGMGSGRKAAVQSRATVSLLEQLIQSGFDKDTTVKLINSVLVLKSNEDSFSTIDMSIIDLYSGEAEFVKIGAVPTYIKSEETVECVRSASLPAGILSDIEVELAHKRVQDGDFIIMMTDGVLDSFNVGSDGENSLKSFIAGIKSTNPQEIADSILDEAYRNYEGKPADDMMVLAAKIWKRVS